MPENRQKQASSRANRTSWQPGQTGNPGGRPKVAAEIRDLAREHGPMAIQRLTCLMHSKNETVAIRAAEAILERGYGRPLQTPASEDARASQGPQADLKKLSDEEFQALLQARRTVRELLNKAMPTMTP